MTTFEQSELALSRKPHRVSIPIDLIRSRKTKGQAFTLACDASGLDDKEIAMSMTPPLDAGTFSRLKSGTNTLDADRHAEFCRVVGNTIYPEWIAYQLNATLVMIQTEAERQVLIERERADRLEAENQLMRDILASRTK